jgi:triacylglycerol lipase
MTKFSTVALILLAGLSSCSGTEPPTIHRDQIYGEIAGEKLLCDVYLPTQATARPIPLVIVIHGGGWTFGSRKHMVPFARRIVDAGMAAISIDYRLAPKYRFPAQVDDVRQAVQWAREQQHQFPFDADRLGLLGYSAGAHLACLMGTLADEPLAVQQSASNFPVDHPIWVRPIQPLAIVAGGVPCDFRSLPPGNRVYSFFLGGSNTEIPEIYRLASPATFASSGDAPTFYYHGDQDVLTSYTDAFRFYSEQRKANVDCRWMTVPQQGHLTVFLHRESREQGIAFLSEKLLLEKRVNPP